MERKKLAQRRPEGKRYAPPVIADLGTVARKTLGAAVPHFPEADPTGVQPYLPISAL